METLKNEREEGRSVSPMNKNGNMFGSSTKFINSRDITME